MRLVLIADVYPPLRSSGAVQLRDLSIELARQRHEVTMMVADPDLDVPFSVCDWYGVRVVRLRTARTRGTGYVRRTIGEILMPFLMLRVLRQSPLAAEAWDGIIWYSPTIFLGPIVKTLKKASGCRSYLIIRDIFPEWAVDMGLMGKGLPYLFFRAIASYQYSVADVIGIQSPGNAIYFANWKKRAAGRLEVLHNWLAEGQNVGCSVRIGNSPLAGRRIFVYAGNMGVAQGMDILLELAELLKERSDVGFVFVGRGSVAPKLRARASALGLSNVLFYDEIEPGEIPGLYAQCHIGLVSLDRRHRTHNIPGKFLSYIHSGLPVLASVNDGNDIVRLIETERVGRVGTDGSAETLKQQAELLLDELGADAEFGSRCKNLSARCFLPHSAARQIVEALRK